LSAAASACLDLTECNSAVLVGVWIAEHNPEGRGAAASDTLVPSEDGETEVRERIR
jgi:hypothetical protein